jgi:gag-polypeptide of LTR copia-type
MVLIEKDLWDIVSGESARPLPNTEVFQLWNKRAEKARATIVLSISPSEFIHINNLTDPIVIWNKLKDIYESKGTAAKHSLL